MRQSAGLPPSSTCDARPAHGGQGGWWLAGSGLSGLGSGVGPAPSPLFLSPRVAGSPADGYDGGRPDLGLWDPSAACPLPPPLFVAVAGVGAGRFRGLHGGHPLLLAGGRGRGGCPWASKGKASFPAARRQSSPLSDFGGQAGAAVVLL